MAELDKTSDTESLFRNATIIELNRYPFKGARGEKPSSVEITPQGILHDREMMAVDNSGMVLSQRKDPNLAFINAHFSDDGNIFNMYLDGQSGVSFEVKHEGPEITSTVHSSTGLQTIDQGNIAAEFVSDVVHKKVRVVRLADNFQRVIKPEYASTLPLGVSNQVGLADGAAISVASYASLIQLNNWIQEDSLGYPSIPFDNFRTNIVVDSFGGPFYEDQVSVAQIGQDLRLHFHWLNARCVVTERNNQDGRFNPKVTDYGVVKKTNAMQPLFSLEKNRHMEYWPGKSGDLFGVNAQPEMLINNPHIRIGQEVRVLQVK